MSNAVPGQQSPAVTIYRQWTQIWYPWFKKLLERVINVEAEFEEIGLSIVVVNTIVDNSRAQWGIAINSDNRIVGAIKLDGTETESEFAVLADKFIVVHPTDDGKTIEAFVAGTVEGVATAVGINGDLNVDGTIDTPSLAANSITTSKLAAGSVTADKIDVSALSAIVANFGTCTAGRIQSANGLSFLDLGTGEFQITGSVYRFRVSPANGAMALYNWAAAGDAPLTNPTGNLSNTVFHSSLRYQGVVGTLSGTLNLPSALTGSNFPRQTTYVLGAHGQGYKPMLFGRWTGLGVGMMGSVPVQQYVDGTLGNTSNVRWLTLGADDTNVFVFEYVRGLVAADLVPAISLTYEVKIIDRNLDAALPNTGSTTFKINSGEIEFTSPKGTFSSAKRYIRQGGTGAFRLAGGKTMSIRYTETTGSFNVRQNTWIWSDGVYTKRVDNVFTGSTGTPTVSLPASSFTPRAENVSLG